MTAIPKGRLGRPQQPEPMGLNKPSRKEVCPKMIRCHPAFRRVFAFRPMAMSTWRPRSLGAHARLMVTFRPTLMLTWCSCFARRSRKISAAHTVHGPQELISHGKNRAACMISGLATRNRAFAGKILTLCIPNSVIASRNAYTARESCHR